VGYTPNPFTNRGVITNEQDFIGREEQLGEIIERLRTLPSSSVVGERRIGKSSLLYHLNRNNKHWDRLNHGDHGDHGDSYGYCLSP